MYQRTVLIVEDELSIRTLLADTLADEGYDVVEAANVLEAVAILALLWQNWISGFKETFAVRTSDVCW